jgi:hypothetical protein
MAITVDTRSASAGSTAASTRSWNHTINSGSNIILIVVASSAASPPRAVSSVFWDTAGVNQALTRLGGAQDDNFLGWTDIWYRKNPTPGATKQITVTYAGSCECAAGAISLFGVDQTTTWNAASPQVFEQNLPTYQPYIIVTSAAAQYVIGGFIDVKIGTSTDSPTPGATGTTIYAVDVSPGNENSTHGGADAAGEATSHTIQWSGCGGSGAWASIGGSLLAAAGGGATVTVPIGQVGAAAVVLVPGATVVLPGSIWPTVTL